MSRLVMSLNESGLLSKHIILEATLVHFHRIICTTIVRVGMTQILFRPIVMDRLSDALLDGVARAPPACAAMPPVFRHILAR
jgi:hypothetical protein